MGNPTYYCRNCGFKEELGKHYYWKCPKCGAPLDLIYDIEWRPKGRGILRYRSMLPVQNIKYLGEGETPLIKRSIKGKSFLFKLEYLNPGGSFKDRGASLTLSYASSLGYSKVVEDTSGNTGIATALYSRINNMQAVIVMPQYAPEGKKNFIRLLGGKIIEAPTRHDAAKKVLELIDEATCYVAHTWNPLFYHANKTIAYEAYEEGFKHGTVVVPIGSGSLLLGIYKGFKDLVDLGLIGTMPRIIGIQGVSSAPIYELIYGKQCRGDSSIADGIMVRDPPRKHEIAEIIKKYGDIVVVDNDEIISSLKDLIRMGFIIEPTSAASLAGILKYIEDKGDVEEPILLPLTGSGLKMIDYLYSLLKKQ